MRDKCHLPHFLVKVFLGLFFAIFATSASFALPAYATPTDPDPVEQTSPEQGNTADSTDSTPTEEEDSTAEEDAPADSTTPTDISSNSDNNCTNQTGAVGWLVCPSTGLISNATDALYSIIENFLVIDPVSFNQDSPIYSIWDYCRGLTNLVFAIVILVIIFSQVTGIGFSNYNIKKTLPRIIVSAILINLSFILCSLLVDLSNIAGASLNNFFNGISSNIVVPEIIIDGQSVTYNLGNIATAIIAGGSIGGVTIAIVAAGGVAAFFWMLVPVLLGALVAIVTGLLTISARQAVVILLVMVAPLAIVASTLPNTEKWFTKWKSLLTQMLVFYPVFSLLFGASRLVGLIFISSATNVYGIILGVAVQVFPLFFSWQLMKMSNTILGGISNRLNGIGQRGVAASRAWAASHQAVAKAQHNATSHAPSASLNRYLENRRARRASDLATYQETAKIRGERYAANVYNRNGQLTRRGERLYSTVGENLINSAEAKRMRAELGEAGYRDDGSDHRIRSGRQQARIAATNQRIVRGVDLNHASDSFVESAKTSNAVSYAERVEAHRNAIISIRNNSTLSEDEKAAQIAATDPIIAQTLHSITDPQTRTQYMNNLFANAISAQAKADKATRDNYSQLYAATQLTRNIHAEFNKSFADKNYNSLEAALDELAKRGDFDLIKESLEAHSGEIIDDVDMQKHLSDTLIKYKADSAPLWAYAKSINIRRAKHAANPDKVALFTTFEEFESGAAPHTLPGESQEVTDSLSMIRLIKEINNPAIAVSQDRTTFKYILQSQRNGILAADELGFQIKQLRSAASSGQIDGEQLANLNMLLTGGMKFDSKGNMLLSATSQDQKDRDAFRYIDQNRATIKANIVDYLANMAAGQLANMKESTFNALNDALIFLEGDAQDYGTGKTMSQTFHNAIYTNAANNMNNILKSNMNTNIKNWLGIQNNRQ